MIKISGCQQEIYVLTSASHLKNCFRIKMQKSFIVSVTLILCSKSNKYLPQSSEDMATTIISKITDRLLLKSKSGNENLADLDKTDTTQELSGKYIVFAILLDILRINYSQK